ncbi:hypothetical protein SteCoe_1768 [Stentor coeruleus]|uniref:Uncharacterized protein n=1 Tax=Stentor coeruleus TaxID=5963 RepID=A0A1R2D0Z9_9CILI|nr:hypothetical protein SteCoe_1768 [Stentor coeruleus]
MGNTNKKTIERTQETIYTGQEENSEFYITSSDKLFIDTGLMVQGHISKIICLALSNNNLIAASGSEDDTIRVWNVYKKHQIGMISWNDRIKIVSIAVGFNKNYVYYAMENKSIRMWNFLEFDNISSEVCRFQRKICDVYLCKNETLLVALLQGTQIGLFELSKKKLDVLSLNHNPDKLFLNVSYDTPYAIYCQSQLVSLWNLVSLERASFTFSENNLTALALSPNKEYLAITLKNNNFMIWTISNENKKLYSIKKIKKITNLSISPDSKSLIISSDENSIYLWSIQDKKISVMLFGHCNTISKAILTDDNKYLVSGSDDCTVRLWDIDYSKTLTHFLYVTSCVLKTKSGLLITGSKDYTFRVWKLKDKLKEGRLPFVDKNSELTLTENNGNYKINFKTPNKYYDHEFHAHIRKVNSVFVARNHQKALSISYQESSLKIWNLQSKKREASIQLCLISKIAIINPSTVAIGLLDSKILIWDLIQKCQITTLFGHSSAIIKLHFIPKTKTLISASKDGIVNLWDFSSYSIIFTINSKNTILNSISLSYDNKILVFTGQDTTELWRIKTDHIKKFSSLSCASPILCSAMCKSNKHIVLGCEDNTVYLLDVHCCIYMNIIIEHSNSVTCIVLSNDDKFVISGSKDLTIKVTNIATKVQVAELRGHNNWVNCLCLSEDGKFLISGSSDKSLIVWDWGNGKMCGVMTGHNAKITDVVDMKMGKIKEFSNMLNQKNSFLEQCCSRMVMTGSLDNTLRIWNIDTFIQEQCLLVNKLARDYADDCPEILPLFDGVFGNYFSQIK